MNFAHEQHNGGGGLYDKQTMASRDASSWVARVSPMSSSKEWCFFGLEA